MIEKTSSTIHLNRLKQLDRFFGTESTIVDSQTLAQVMSCSTRNVAKTMKNLRELGWIEWVPGRGRGIKTQLQVKRSFHEVLCDVIKEYVARGELNEASRYADIFQYQTVFKQHLPDWIAELSGSKERSDELISLVPYTLPPCHPMYMKDRNAGMYVSVLFDTLITFDQSSKTFTPHLAHQFYKEGLTYYFRIRPDVYFHNGELLTPEHVKASLEAHKSEGVLAHELYNCINNIRVNKQWVEITLDYDDPIFLHAVADVHSAIFMHNASEPDYPFGTGPYYWGNRTANHWSLQKNNQYFSQHGILRKADFWHVLRTNKTSVGHLFEVKDVDKKVDTLPGLQTSQLGTKSLCLSHRLDSSSRSAITRVCQQVLLSHYQDSHFLCHTLFQPAENTEYSTPTNTELKADLPSSIKVLKQDQHIFQHLWFRFNQLGIKVDFVDDCAKAELWINEFLVGQDEVLDRYYWMLLSASAIKLLTPFKRQQWLAEVQKSDNVENTLIQLERRYLSQNRIVPLWKKSIAFKSHQSLRGTDINSLGFMNLSTIWFDKRES
ncbi:SgrR family transcriptional regulator [Vibrio rarus]|uniref:SgrR family transcriptional regulator n=1 Tax=Vibrio rarus TaxID=413403 RepID=UPI0021C4B398|nr:SgrR family transcriptional regulator [Vibrio rarus]